MELSMERDGKSSDPGRSAQDELAQAKRLLDKTRQQLEAGRPEDAPTAARYERLLKISASLLEARESDLLLGRILDAAIETTEAERGLVLLREGTSGALEIRRASPSIDAATREDALVYSRGVVEGAIQDGRTLLCGDATTDSRFSTQRSVIDLGILSLVCVPLRAGQHGEIVGTLYLDNRTSRGIFTPQDVSFLEGLAGIASLALVQLRTVEGLRRENVSLRREAHRRYSFPELVGDSPAMQELFLRIRQLLNDTSTVLISGETGTGKEMVARAIHFNGPRRDKPFLAISCAALAENLLESELFGHVRGAFTDAHADKPGLLEAAGEGTVLLDDINQMSPQMQSKVLRVLQEREVRRVGGVQTLPVAARILCATNEDLHARVQSGTFRQDLYYRISVIPLRLPPLRERQEDVPALAARFLQRFCREKQRQVILGDAALDLLCRFDWPGNIRQLENEIERAVVFAEEGGTIQPEDLSEEIRITAGEPTEDEAAKDRSKRRFLTQRLASYERYLVLQALAAEDGNVSRTAKRLGLTRQGLQQKLKRLGLARPGSKKTPPNSSHEQDAP